MYDDGGELDFEIWDSIYLEQKSLHTENDIYFNHFEK